MKYCPICEQEYPDHVQHCPQDQSVLVIKPAQDPLLGRVLKDQYRIEAFIGEGGMATVYRAVQLQLGRHVAIKVMLPSVQATPEFVKRFFREARLLSQLNHPNVVSIIDFGNTEDGLIFMVMEYLAGHSLDQHVPQHQGLTLPEISTLFQQICAGVGAAHQCPLVHRDLKPSNIFLAEVSGSKRIIKVLDFGISKNLNEEDDVKTQTGIVMGTPGYMSPEQITAATTPTTQSDIYALGALLYFMASGHRPFCGDTSHAVLLKQTYEPPPLIDPSRFAEANVKQLMPVIYQAMQIKAEDRFKTTDDMMQAFYQALNPNTPPDRSGNTAFQTVQHPEQLVTHIGPTSATPPPTQRRNRWIPAVIFVLLVSVVSLGILFKSALPGFQSAPLASGITEDRVLFGMSGAFSGPSSALGREMRVGIETYFRAVNAQGGIRNKHLQLIALDDGYEPDKALANMHELLEKRKVFAIIGNTGTPTAKAAMPYVLKKKTLFYGAFTGAGLLRQDPPARYVINYRASYAEETAAMVHYFANVKRINAEEIAVFSQSDSYGDAGHLGVQKQLRQLNVNPEHMVHVRYARNTLDVQAAVDEVLHNQDRIKAIVMVGTYKACAKFIQGVVDGGHHPEFASVSFVGSRALSEALLELGSAYAKGVIVTQVVPFYLSQSTGVLEYLDDLKHYYPQEKPGFVSLEGYIAAKTLIQGFKVIQGDITTENLISALESIKDLDLGIGSVLSFGPSKHQASNRVWGTVLNEKGEYTPLDLK